MARCTVTEEPALAGVAAHDFPSHATYTQSVIAVFVAPCGKIPTQSRAFPVTFVTLMAIVDKDIVDGGGVVCAYAAPAIVARTRLRDNADSFIMIHFLYHQIYEFPLLLSMR